MVKYYIDISIWMDYKEGRKDRFRPLGDWAAELLKKIIEECDIIIFSDQNTRELSKFYSIKEIDDLLSIIKTAGLLKMVEASENQSDEAKKLAKEMHIPVPDALHALIARDNNAIMVYRDTHFYELQNVVTIKKPEELI